MGGRVHTLAYGDQEITRALLELAWSSPERAARPGMPGVWPTFSEVSLAQTASGSTSQKGCGDRGRSCHQRGTRVLL